MLKPLTLTLAVTLATVFCPPVAAQSQGDTLAKCLTDSTTGRDRKNLARWIFVAMAAHPEIKELGTASPEAAEDTSKAMASLVTRLLTESCPKEVRAVARGEGAQAMVKAFETLGQVAMMELMSNPAVAAAISRFERFVDQDKVNAVFADK